MQHFDLLLRYFPNLTEQQIKQFEMLYPLYKEWNAKINVISRKDIEELYLRHVLHSLSICKFIQFKEGTKIVDIGTGGGFPGIPLAIYFPKCQFYLVDSTRKKVKVVKNVIETLELTNALGVWGRVEHQNLKAHFFVSRAVAPFNELISWCAQNIKGKSYNDLPNGLIALKGGDLTKELAGLKNVTVTPLISYFREDFFETKKIVYKAL